jgi:subfamily B ATP-binding cassette protein MsbA
MAATANSLAGLALYKRLLGYVRPLLGAFLLSILGFIIYAAASTWFFDLVGQLIDAIEAGVNSSAAARIRIPLTLMLLVLCRAFGGFLGTYCMAWVAYHVVHRLRCEIMTAFMRQPLAFHDRQASGHLLSTVTFNVAQVTAAVSDSLTVMLREGSVVIGLIAYLLYLNWKLTLIFVLIAPLISGVVVLASRHFRRYSKRIQTSMGDVTQILSEALKGLKVIRTFGAEQQINAKFAAASARNMQQNLKLAVTAAISAPIVHMLVAAAIAALIWLAMAPEALASITPGEFAAYITAAGSLLKPIRQTSKVNADIQKGLAAAASIFAVLDLPGEQDKGTHTCERVKGKVEFRNVSFAYDSAGEPVLHRLDLLCEPGKTVAIVGKSGSGKTTLVSLIPRFYELRDGHILIDDIAHTAYTLHNLRHQIAFVSQQVVLFNGSIRENIAYGELAGATDAEIEQALQSANAMEFIRELPQGLDTLVGDDGLLLSGGQRQRLAIARALLKDAPILILDEATSALDTASERYIQSALEKLMQGRTTLVIAHRLSTIEKADLIVVMDKGRIVESGTHQGLLAKNGIYAGLHRMQFTEVEEVANG